MAQVSHVYGSTIVEAFRSVGVERMCRIVHGKSLFKLDEAQLLSRLLKYRQGILDWGGGGGGTERKWRFTTLTGRL